ncbi:MAG: LysR substrate-binding domain-containing protein [Elstera sp.]
MTHSFRDEFPYAHPPLEGLETVCLIARLGSVSAAAAELGLTHGAVSRRLAGVETWLGHQLFERHGRGMRPTPDGQRFLGRIEEAFRLIAVASEPLRLRRGPEVVRVSLVPAFAEFVVLPRLAALEAGTPALRIELTAEHRLADLESGVTDVALRYGRGQWPNVTAYPLAAEQLVPVASLAVADRLGWEPSVDQILAEPLLHDSDPSGWRAWLGESPLRVAARPQDRRFEDYQLVLAAAEAGLGIALLRLPMAQRVEARGSLRRLSARTATSLLTTHAVTRLGPLRPAVLTFITRLQACLAE